MDHIAPETVRKALKKMNLSPGSAKKMDYHYERNGTCNILLACEPLQGVRYVVVRERRTKEEYAHFMKDLADNYPGI